MNIVVDDLSGQQLADFLAEHIREMQSVSPPESKHALDLDSLRAADITVWTVWDKQTLVGCGALKALSASHAEIKSMRTSVSMQRKGVASKLLQHIIEQASNNHFCRLSLETGSMPYFLPARRLYAKFGFRYCEPFADYSADPNSVFMTLSL